MTPLQANALCLLSMLVWAMGLPAADMLIGSVPPLLLTAARMAVAATVMLPVWFLLDGRAAVRGAAWGRGILIGGGTLGLGAFLLVLAQRETDAVTVAVVSAAMPLVGIGIECVADGRQLSLAMVLGLALSIVGGLMAYGAAVGSLDMGLGAFCALASIIAYTLGSRMTVTSFPALTPLGRTALTLAGAAIATAIAAAVSLAMGAPGPDWAALGLPELGALLVYGLLAMAFSQILWIASIGHIGIGLGSMHINAAPFYVMFFLFLLGDPWNWTQALGAAVVGAGVLLAQSGPARQVTTG